MLMSKSIMGVVASDEFSVGVALGKYPGWRAISDVYLYNSQHTNTDAVSVIPEKWEIKQVIRSSTTTQCTGIYSGYLVDNNYI